MGKPSDKHFGRKTRSAEHTGEKIIKIAKGVRGGGRLKAKGALIVVYIDTIQELIMLHSMKTNRSFTTLCYLPIVGGTFLACRRSPHIHWHV